MCCLINKLRKNTRIRSNMDLQLATSTHIKLFYCLVLQSIQTCVPFLSNVCVSVLFHRFSHYYVFDRALTPSKSKIMTPISENVATAYNDDLNQVCVFVGNSSFDPNPTFTMFSLRCHFPLPQSLNFFSIFC